MTTRNPQQGSQSPAPTQQQGTQGQTQQQQAGQTPPRFTDWAAI